jgi:hypothetical protein
MNLDFDNVKNFIMNFINQNKKILIPVFSVFIVFSVVIIFIAKNNYEQKISSSNMLIDYINGKNELFLNKKHKKGYALIKDITISNKNPSKKDYDNFAKVDDYVFKNLFYFSKILYFNEKDAFHSYYENEKNPWSDLIIKSRVFNGEKEAKFVKNKELDIEII